MMLGHDWWVLMAAVMAAFWGLVIVASILVLRGLDAQASSHAETPVEALDRRLARGEISAADYHEQREALGLGALH